MSNPKSPKKPLKFPELEEVGAAVSTYPATNRDVAGLYRNQEKIYTLLKALVQHQHDLDNWT